MPFGRARGILALGRIIRPRARYRPPQRVRESLGEKTARELAGELAERAAVNASIDRLRQQVEYVQRQYRRAQLDLPREAAAIAQNAGSGIVRAVVISALRRRTPVDTGRARASWRASDGPFSRDLPSGLINITFSAVDYMEQLNQGHSNQAPSGFVDRTLGEAGQAIQSAFDEAVSLAQGIYLEAYDRLEREYQRLVIRIRRIVDDQALIKRPVNVTLNVEPPNSVRRRALREFRARFRELLGWRLRTL